MFKIELFWFTSLEPILIIEFDIPTILVSEKSIILVDCVALAFK